MSIKKYWLHEAVEDEEDTDKSEVEDDADESEDLDLEEDDTESDESEDDVDLDLEGGDEETDASEGDEDLGEDDSESEDLDLDADDSEDGEDLDLSLDDEGEEGDEESDGEEMFDESEDDESVEIENLQDDEDLEIDGFGDEESEDGEDEELDVPDRGKELDFNDDGGSGSGFDSWLEDAGVTGETSEFENFDELPENEDLESDSGNDEFGVEVRSVFTGREKVGPESVEEAVATGRTLTYDEHELWVADTRKNGYRVAPKGGSSRTGDQIWVASYKDGSEVGRFSQESSSGHLSFVISEGRDVLRLFEADGAPPSSPKPPAQQGAKKPPAAPKAKYAFDSEDKVPKTAKWLQIEPSKVGAADADETAKKVQQAGLAVLFATSAYGKAKVAYAGATPPEKVQAAMVKLGLSDAEASGDPSAQQAPGAAKVPGSPEASGQVGQDPAQGAGEEDLSSQVDDDPDYQPQRVDHPEEEPDEDTLHISVKGTDEVVASLKDAGIKVKSFGNHKDGDYIRVDAMDAAKAHEWMLSHGWDENEAQHAVGTAKSKASLAPIKKAMQDVLGDKAPDMNSHEDFAKWLRSAHGDGEGSGKGSSSAEDSDKNAGATWKKEDEFDRDAYYRDMEAQKSKLDALRGGSKTSSDEEDSSGEQQKTSSIQVDDPRTVLKALKAAGIPVKMGKNGDDVDVDIADPKHRAALKKWMTGEGGWDEEDIKDVYPELLESDSPAKRSSSIQVDRPEAVLKMLKDAGIPAELGKNGDDVDVDISDPKHRKAVHKWMVKQGGWDSSDIKDLYPEFLDNDDDKNQKQGEKDAHSAKMQDKVKASSEDPEKKSKREAEMNRILKKIKGQSEFVEKIKEAGKDWEPAAKVLKSFEAELEKIKKKHQKYS